MLEITCERHPQVHAGIIGASQIIPNMTLAQAVSNPRELIARAGENLGAKMRESGCVHAAGELASFLATLFR